MSHDEIYQKLTSVFQDVFRDDISVVVPEMTARDVDDWDSLSHIRLILTVEKEFGVKFSTAELAQFENVEQLVEMIADKILTE